MVVGSIVAREEAPDLRGARCGRFGAPSAEVKSLSCSKSRLQFPSSFPASLPTYGTRSPPGRTGGTRRRCRVDDCCPYAVLARRPRSWPQRRSRLTPHRERRGSLSGRGVSRVLRRGRHRLLGYTVDAPRVLPSRAADINRLSGRSIDGLGRFDAGVMAARAPFSMILLSRPTLSGRARTPLQL